MRTHLVKVLQLAGSASVQVNLVQHVLVAGGMHLGSTLNVRFELINDARRGGLKVRQYSFASLGGSR